MPKTVLEFGEWNPDGGPINNSGLWFSRNVIKINDNYESTPSIGLTSFAGGGNSIGSVIALHYHIKRSGKDPLFFAGVASKLHVIEQGETVWIDASGASSPYSATDWSFASFGPTVIATNGVDPIQGYTVADTFDSAENFADLLVTTSPTTADILPKHICVFKNHVFAANITMAADWPAASPQFSNGTLYPELVWWSDTDNATRFGDIDNTPQLKNSGWFLLYDGHGEITGFAVATDVLYLFKERAIYRCDGSPFTFSPLAIGTGCTETKSICVLDGEVYFWSNVGPCKISISGEVVRLGQDSCYRSLAEGTYYKFPSGVAADEMFSINMDSTTRTVWSVADVSNKVVAFYYNSDDTDETTPEAGYANSVLLYNASTNKFYYMNNSITGGDYYVNANVRVPVSVQSTNGCVLGNVGIISSGASTVLSYQSGAGSFSSGSGEGSCYLRLPFARFGSGASRITKIRPLLNFIPGTTSAWKFRVGVITRQAITPSGGVDTEQAVTETTSSFGTSGSGWLDLSNTSTGLTHSIGVSFSPLSSQLAREAVFRDISGIEVEYAELGVRGA